MEKYSKEFFLENPVNLVEKKTENNTGGISGVFLTIIIVCDNNCCIFLRNPERNGLKNP